MILYYLVICKVVIMEKSRNYNLDFYRGFAAIWIVFIHCCFWSGESYVPQCVKSLSLFIDVPLFMFISGMTYNYLNSVKKTIKGLVKLYFKYIVFFGIYMLFVLYFDYNSFNFENLKNGLLFKYSDTMPLQVVGGSMWFMPMYFFVSFFSSIFISCVDKFVNTKKNLIWFIIMILVFYLILNFISIPLVLFLKEMTFFIIIYLLGYYAYNNKLSFKKFIIIFSSLSLFLIILLLKTDYSFRLMQSYKSAFNFVYFTYSMLSIFIVWYINSIYKVKNNIVCTIGKNAILFYFAQGVGSSLLLPVCYRIEIFWAIKLILLFILNLTYTVLISLMLNGVYKLIERIKIKNPVS